MQFLISVCYYYYYYYSSSPLFLYDLLISNTSILFYTSCFYKCMRKNNLLFTYRGLNSQDSVSWSVLISTRPPKMSYKLTDFSLNYAFKSVPDSPLPKYLLPRIVMLRRRYCRGWGSCYPTDLSFIYFLHCFHPAVRVRTTGQVCYVFFLKKTFVAQM